tara:strand:+ start:4111 stop:6537 length:2427 start_codon:yes stop_codon:yes gene_type:complete
VEEEDGSPSVRPVNTIKVTDGTLTDDGGATVTIDTSGSGGTPGGFDTTVQYNNAGAFGGDADFKFDGTTVEIENACWINGDINSKVPSGGDWSLVARDTTGTTLQGAIFMGGGADEPVQIFAGEAGSDADIQLIPGSGSGAVEISGAYKLPTAVTSTNDYVLTAQTDGSTAWAAASAGGSPAGDSTNPKSIQFNDGGSFGGDSNLVFDDSSNNMRIGLGVNYPRLALAGNNGYLYFQNNAATPVTQASVGVNGTTFYVKTFPTDTERLRITTNGEWGIEGANYGTDGQVLTSGGAGASVSWEDAATGGSPAGSTGELQYNNGGAFGALPSTVATFDGTDLTKLTIGDVSLASGNGLNINVSDIGWRPPAGGSNLNCFGGDGQIKGFPNSNSASQPFYAFNPPGNSGMFPTGTDEGVGFSVNGSEKIRFQNDGEIGIGGANYGTDGQVLTSGGAGASVAWEDAAGGGIGGSITDNQVAYGDLTANDIEGNAKFTYNVSTQTLDIAAGTGTGVLMSGSDDLVLRNSTATEHSKITLRYDAGGNSAIHLDTDGTGTVDVYHEGVKAYGLPNAVTSTNDYVLTAQTDGTTAWAAAGGSGTPLVPPFQPVPGGTGDAQWMPSNPFTTSPGGSSMSLGSAINKPSYYPFYAGDNTKIDGLMLKVAGDSTDASTPQVKCAIYTMATITNQIADDTVIGTPMTKVANSDATFAVDNSVASERRTYSFATDVELTANTWYCIGIVGGQAFTSYPSIRRHGNVAIQYSPDVNYMGWTNSGDDDYTFPASYSAGDTNWNTSTAFFYTPTIYFQSPDMQT